MPINDPLCPTHFPALYIGRAALEFKKTHPGPIRFVNDPESLRELISYYYTIPKLPYPLVIEDISFLQINTVSILLKFIEDTSLSIILLSIFDRVPSPLLSRMRFVLKNPLETPRSDFVSVGTGARRLEELIVQDTSEYDRLRQICKVSPLIYYYEKHNPYIRGKTNIFDLLE